MFEKLKKDVNGRMESALNILKKEFSGLHAGRASASLLDTIRVEIAGSKLPLNQLATINVMPPRTLKVDSWDSGTSSAIYKAIANSDLNLNPSQAGNSIHIRLPELSEERRKELVKVAHNSSELSRVSIRNIRRDGLNDLKKMEKNGDISKDDLHKHTNVIQKATDDFIKKAEELFESKKKEIMEK